jgi:hypothetical protein
MAILVEIWEPWEFGSARQELIRRFYIDAGTWGAPQGNLGGDDNIFFDDCPGTQFLVTPEIAIAELRISALERQK